MTRGLTRPLPAEIDAKTQEDADIRGYIPIFLSYAHTNTGKFYLAGSVTLQSLILFLILTLRAMAQILT